MLKLTSAQIRLLRHARQMKQSAVAKKMKITKQRYSELENHGNLKPQAIERILRALSITPEVAKKYLEAVPPLISK